MLLFKLPTNRVEYLQLAFQTIGAGMVVRWGTQVTPYTVGLWSDLSKPRDWEISGQAMNLSPDGEWVSVIDKEAGEVRVTRVGTDKPFAVVVRDKKLDNMWTGVAPGGVAIAWKEEPLTIVRAIPSGEPIAKVKTGWAVDFQFSPGGRWLSERGLRVFRVFDRADNHRVVARIKTPRFTLAEVSDGLTAAVRAGDNLVDIWDLSKKSSVASLKTRGHVTALAVSVDGRGCSLELSIIRSRCGIRAVRCFASMTGA